MSEFYDQQWYDDRWNSVPAVMRKIAADAIKKAISDKDMDLIRHKHAEYGPHMWIHYLIDVSEEEQGRMNDLLDENKAEGRYPETMSAHHGFGTAIRNLLRDEGFGAGIKDDALPMAPYEDGLAYANWDDYYVQAIEAAAGLRE